MTCKNMTISQDFSFRRPVVLLIALAGLALLTGVVIYVLDRSPSNVYFLRGWINEAEHRQASQDLSEGYFGHLGYYLPTLLHTFAFILLTMALVIPYQSFKKYILRVCLAWFVIESLFELAQMDTIANQIARRFSTGFAEIPFIENIPNYFIAGTFDVLDLLSIAVGAIAAYLTVQYFAQNKFINA
jgi:hypothetical protein